MRHKDKIVGIPLDRLLELLQDPTKTIADVQDLTGLTVKEIRWAYSNSSWR